MTHRKLQLLVIKEIFTAQRAGASTETVRVAARLGWPLPEVLGATQRLQRAGLLCAKGRLTFTGLVVAAAVRDQRHTGASRKPECVTGLKCRVAPPSTPSAGAQRQTETERPAARRLAA